MKKELVFTLLIALICCLAACSDDDDDPSWLGARVDVEVVNILEQPLEGRTVYMFKDHDVTDNTNPADADKQVVTNSDGIAVFDLNLTELNIFESQTTLYFAVFYQLNGETVFEKSTGITIKRNQSRDLQLKLLL